MRLDVVALRCLPGAYLAFRVGAFLWGECDGFTFAPLADVALYLALALQRLVLPFVFGLVRDFGLVGGCLLYTSPSPRD